VALNEGIDKTPNMSDTHLTNLESTIAFQEQTISDLSDVIVRHQEEIDLLKAQVKEITVSMAQGQDDLPSGGLPANEKPPHY
jgi:uncharacterized coiled-coil protein SlyX